MSATSGRTAILSRIRASLGVSATDTERRCAVEKRMSEPPHLIVPARASASGDDLIALFVSFLAAQGTDLLTAPDATDVPTAIAEYLSHHALPPRLRHGSDPVLAGLPWESAPDLQIESGPAVADDTAAGLSHALAGVAETGTLVIASGPENPVTLAFVPDVHIVVLERAHVVGCYEEAYARAQLGRSAALPRTLNLISGASRTGDIAGKIVMGAHGPRRLAVVLVGRASLEM